MTRVPLEVINMNSRLSDEFNWWEYSEFMFILVVNWKTLDSLLVSCVESHCTVRGSLQLGAWQLSSIWQQTKIELPSGSRRCRLLVQLSISLCRILRIRRAWRSLLVARCLLAPAFAKCVCSVLPSGRVKWRASTSASRVSFAVDSSLPSSAPLATTHTKQSTICRVAVSVCARPFINFHFPSISR